MNTSKSLEDILSGFAMYATWYGFDKAMGTEGKHTSLTRTEAMEAAKQAIVEAVEGLIDREPEVYQKYLVVSKKLGIEDNQNQARLLARAIDMYKAELLQAIKEWQ